MGEGTLLFNRVKYADLFCTHWLESCAVGHRRGEGRGGVLADNSWSTTTSTAMCSMKRSLVPAITVAL